MINKIECAMLECDNCKDHYESPEGFGIFVDELSMIQSANEVGWIVTDKENGTYCDKCYHLDDEDEIILNDSRTKNHTI